MSEENEEKSTWDELVGELGVNVTDDALERRQPPPKELPTRRREQVEEVEATPSDWEGLASSLGIDVPPVAEEPPVKKPTASRTEKPAPAVPRAELKPRDEEPKIEIEVESVRVDSSEFVEQTDDSEDEANEAPTISGEAARSAFDALFAADAASWGSAFVSARTNVESSFLFTEGEEAVFAEDISDKSADDDEDDEDEGEQKKGRRRRRRGGRGRGRGGVKTGTSSEEENKDGAEGDETSETVSEESSDSETTKDEAAPEKRRRRRRSRGRGRSKDDKELTPEEEDSRIKQRLASQLGEDDDDDDDDLDDELLDDDGSPSATGSRPSHRNLPTWDEAIGVIVDTNLSQRSKQPARQSSGSSRGRGRGGRRHKKS
ncbi:hypothetical protein [Bythopirellula goksoeyrii]|uniref:Uncharacterized protein n=1 Tax=Bythopirellula goksoeyrii TaxID=1400387 RepID=A0A5B9QCL3_9BACT|nr:hypothetical protein [Bythopirellula goksoeyrii]QEG35345.1 hypothetical protein Pr1d_26430 [Bythopirellula goksoeyrii]